MLCLPFPNGWFIIVLPTVYRISPPTMARSFSARSTLVVPCVYIYICIYICIYMYIYVFITNLSCRSYFIPWRSLSQPGHSATVLRGRVRQVVRDLDRDGDGRCGRERSLVVFPRRKQLEMLEQLGFFMIFKEFLMIFSDQQRNIHVEKYFFSRI